MLCQHAVYVTAIIMDVMMKCVMVDAGSSLKVIPLSIFEATGVSRDMIIKQPIEVSGLEGTSIFNFGFIDIKLSVGPIITMISFTNTKLSLPPTTNA